MNEPIRAYGDITAIRAKFRRVIRRGRAILDEIDGGRQTINPEWDSDADALFPHTAVARTRKNLSQWLGSIENLIESHVPSMQEAALKRPVPEPQPGLSSADLLDAFETYVETTVKELEVIAAAITNDGRG